MRISTSTQLSSGKNLLLLALTALLALGLTACGDESISSGEQPEFNATPSSITFPQVNLGEEVSREIVIQNTGQATLRIWGAEIVANGNASIDGFSPGLQWPGDVVQIAPNDFHQFTVVYQPLQETTYAGIIQLRTNVTNLQVAQIPLNTQGLAPELYAPRNVDFPRTPAGTSDWQIVEINNIGVAPLQIGSIYTNDGGNFDVTFPGALIDGAFPPANTDSETPPVSVLQPTDPSMLMRVWFNPVNDDPDTGELTIESNDPRDSQFVISLSGNSGAACLEVSHPDGIHFNLATIGQTTYRTITIKNCAPGTDLDLSNLSISNDGGGVFSIRPNSYPGNLPGENFILPPQQTANVVVGYAPTDEETNSGELLIVSNDNAQPQLRLPITGEGSHSQCPIAEAAGSLTTSSQWQQVVIAAPLDTVELSSEGSNDPDGTTLSYEWSVISRPSGSNSSLDPSPTAANPTFWIDVAGVYHIELTVFDEVGMASCETATVEINAYPSEDIHVELTWTAPNVTTPNPATFYGTDLDLHYLHENGQWGDGIWSIYYGNLSANWDGGYVSLDWDSLFGEAPENLNHSDPQFGRNYHVGIHYYNDQGYGAADATVRVYFGQTLAWQGNKRLSNVNDLWRPVVIQWDATPQIHHIDQWVDGHGLFSAGGW